MNIVNHTGSVVYWSVSSPGQGDCGTLAPGEKFYLPVPPGPTYDVRFNPQDPKWFQTNAQADQTVSISVSAVAAKADEARAGEPEAAAAI